MSEQESLSDTTHGEIGESLHEALLMAHRQHDGARMAVLYEQAAEHCRIKGDTRAECFYLTHAYVFALEADLPTDIQIRLRLQALGCEDPDSCNLTTGPASHRDAR